MNPLNPLHLVLAVAVFGFGSPAFAVTPSAFDSSRKGVNSASADVPNVQTPASAPAGGSKGCMNAKSRANQIVKCVLTEDEFKGIKEKANQTILVSLSRYLGRSKHLAPNFDFAILNEAVPQWMASANSDDLSTLFMVIGNPDKDNDFSWETDPKLFDLSKSLGGKLSNQLTASLSKEPTINDAKGVKDFFTHAVAAAHKILSSRGGPTKEILHPVYSDGSSVLGWAAGAKEEAGIDDIKLLAKGRSMREMYFDDPVAEGLDPGKLHLPKMETFVCAKQDANIARDCRRLIFKVVTIRSGKEYRTGYRVYDTTNEGDIRASNFVSWTSRGDIELKSLGYKYTMHIDGNGSVKIKRTDGEPGALCLEVANGVEEAFRRRALQVRASGKIKIGTKEYYAFYQGGPVGSYLLFDVEAVNQCNDACDNIDPTTIRPAAVADVAQVNGDLVTEMKEGKLDMGALDDGSGEKKAYHLEMENGHLVAKEGPGDVEEGGEGAEIAGDDEKALDKLVSDSGDKEDKGLNPETRKKVRVTSNAKGKQTIFFAPSMGAKQNPVLLAKLPSIEKVFSAGGYIGLQLMPDEDSPRRIIYYSPEQLVATFNKSEEKAAAAAGEKTTEKKGKKTEKSQNTEDNSGHCFVGDPAKGATVKPASMEAYHRDVALNAMDVCFKMPGEVGKLHANLDKGGFSDDSKVGKIAGDKSRLLASGPNSDDADEVWPTLHGSKKKLDKNESVEGLSGESSGKKSGGSLYTNSHADAAGGTPGAAASAGIVPPGEARSDVKGNDLTILATLSVGGNARIISPRTYTFKRPITDADFQTNKNLILTKAPGNEGIQQLTWSGSALAGKELEQPKGVFFIGTKGVSKQCIVLVSWGMDLETARECCEDGQLGDDFASHPWDSYIEKCK